MQVIKKFIINRDNLKYLYAEVLVGNFNNVQYYIYHDVKHCEAKSQDDFSVTYGNNIAIPLYDAMVNIDNNIVDIDSTSTNVMLNNIKILKDRFRNSNTWNPSLWGYKETLLSSIDTYNRILDNRELSDEYDYERDYNRLAGNDIDDLLERIKEYDNAA